MQNKLQSLYQKLNYSNSPFVYLLMIISQMHLCCLCTLAYKFVGGCFCGLSFANNIPMTLASPKMTSTIPLCLLLIFLSLFLWYSSCYFRSFSYACDLHYSITKFTFQIQDMFVSNTIILLGICLSQHEPFLT